MAINDFVAHLKFEGDLLDESANNHDGTSPANLTYSTGASGQGVIFNGTSSAFEMANSTLINDMSVTDRAFSFFIRPSTVPTTTRAVIYEEGGASKGFGFYLYDSKLWFGAWTNDAFNSTYISTPVSANEVYHICGSWSSTDGEMKLWKNKALVVLDTSPDGAIGAHTGDITFGNSSDMLFEDASTANNTQWLDAMLDEFYIYNHTLTNDDVRDLGAEIMPTPTYYWRFDGSGDFASLEGTNTLSDDATTTYSAAGIQGGSREFDESNSNYLFVPTSLTFGADSTFVWRAWVRNQSGKSTYGLAANSGSDSATDKYIQIEDDGQVAVNISSEYKSATPTSFAQETFALIMVTVDGSGNGEIYVNGENTGSFTMGGIGGGSTGMTRLGKGQGSNYFSGLFDEIAYFNQGLTPAQAEEYWNNGNMAYWDGTVWTLPVAEETASAIFFSSEF